MKLNNSFKKEISLLPPPTPLYHQINPLLVCTTNKHNKKRIYDFTVV